MDNLTAESRNTLIGSSFIGEDEELETLKEFLFSMLFLLLVLIPVMVPTVTASYSFVGEKINRSLEPLLATPASDLELLMGKSGSIFAITMAATLASFVLCVISVNLLTEPYLAVAPPHQGLLLHTVYHWPNRWDYVPAGKQVPQGESALWGDYHLLELVLLLSRLHTGQIYPTFFRGGSAGSR